MSLRRLAMMIVMLRLLGPERAAAQSSVAMDVAVARVTYDGFLTSNAVTLAPTFSFASPRANALAGIVATFFESGSRSSIVSLDGAWRAMARGRASLELRGSTGASFYTYSNPAADALAGLRLRFGGRSSGVWAGADAGGLVGREFNTGVARLDIGAWWRGRDGTLRLDATPTALSGAQFTDITTDIGWQLRRIELAGVAGHRGSPQSELRASFGALAARLRFTPSVDAGVSWGRSLPDLLRSSPGARYATVSVRIRSLPYQQPRITRRRDDTRRAPSSLHSVTTHGDTTILVIRARDATRVELSGNFTSWEPVALEPVGRDQWRGVFVLRPGVHRYNVRLNGGAWMAPAGAGRMSDDFGAESAVLVVQPHGG